MKFNPIILTLSAGLIALIVFASIIAVLGLAGIVYVVVRHFKTKTNVRPSFNPSVDAPLTEEEDKLTEAKDNEVLNFEAVKVPQKHAHKKTLFPTTKSSIINPDELKEPVTLKSSIQMAEALGFSNEKITKKTIANHLKETFGDSIELNERDNETLTGLPLADTHYALSKDGERKCFIYVFQFRSGNVFILLNTTREVIEELRKPGRIIKRSSFPRMGEWYSVLIDFSFTELELFKFIDKVKELTVLPEKPDLYNGASLFDFL